MKTRAVAIIILGLLIVGLLMWLTVRRDDVGQTRKLPDGSTLQLLEVVFPRTNYTFQYRRGNPFIRKILPLLPSSMRGRFTGGSGSLGWSGLEGTNLIAITINRSDAKGWTSFVGRLRFFDDQGNVYDAAWGASMLGNPGEAVQGWRAFAFPRRGRVIGLQFMANNPTGTWTNVAEFRIRNPVHGEYPQWKPEAWPNTKQDGTLAVTLKEFKASAQMGGIDLPLAGRTRLIFSFAEGGTESSDWHVQKLTISDATGNHWSPYLDFLHQRWNWTTNGIVDFFGALWPGEQAWKLRVEAVRTGGFETGQLSEVRVPLPQPNIVTPLTNTWEHDGMLVKLVSIASPETDHPGDFSWIAKWWGEGKEKIFSIALSVNPKASGKRLSVVRAIDQDDRNICIVQHGGQDSDKQAVFFTPADGATEARFTFAIQRSRFVEFVARPEFGQAETAQGVPVFAPGTRKETK